MPAQRYTMAYHLDQMVAAPAGDTNLRVIFRSEDGVLLCYGTSVPADATTGYATGCLFLHTDGGDATALYVNEGDADSANFNAVTVAA